MTSRPFFARLIVLFAILLALIVAVCGGVIYVSSQRAVRDVQTQQLRQLVPLIRGWVADSSPDAIESASTRQRFNDAASLLQTRITLVQGDGRVILDTHQSPALMDNHNLRPEVIDARRKGDGMAVRHSNTLNEESIYVAELVDPAKPDGMIVRASFPKRSWTQLAVPGWQVVGGGVLAALLAVGVLWSILQRRWIGPTQDLVRTADQLAAGQWHERAQPRGAEQLQFFSTRLNLVASHAQQQLADLHDQRADLQALVDTLPDPVLLTAPDGKVMLINLPAARLLDLSRQQALGNNIIQVVTDEAVLQMVDRVSSRIPHGAEPATHQPGAASNGFNGDSHADDPPPLTRVIRLHRDGQYLTFQAVGKRTTNGGVLLVLRDVTALAGAVQMKTDFVANASHELRTPIAAIKIAFETLREVFSDDAVQAERCMGIIDGHLKRLEAMLGDLLDLSRVENPNLKPQVKRLKTSEVLGQVRSSLGPMARQKLVELRLGEDAADNAGANNAAEPMTEFLCDERLLGLVIKNLVENAVKFTPPGGSVTLTIRRGPSTDSGEPSVALAVADTGIGIPPEHLDRVFERFYQVDAARSGSAGRGTGLGLAIVKHALAALGGTVEIESTVGEGTTVTCILPQLEMQPELDENLA